MAFFPVLRALVLGPKATSSERDLAGGVVDVEGLGEQMRQEMKRLGTGSLGMYVVDGGSNGGELMELAALTNSYYDVERFGLRFVASPRHADILLIAGPITRNLAAAVKVTYEAVSRPCLVVAVGDGACTGGVWKGAYGVVGPVDMLFPVDAKIMGDPPSPERILQGLLALLRNVTR